MPKKNYDSHNRWRNKTVANSIYQRSELDWLIYNDPLAYAKLILNGNIANYLKSVSYMNDKS